MIYFILMICGAGAAMIKSLLLPRLLSTADFGLYSLYYQTASILLPLVTLGAVESFMLRYGRVPSFSDQGAVNDYWANFLSIHTLAVILVVPLSWTVGYWFLPGSNDVTWLLALSVLTQQLFFWFVRTERTKLNTTVFAVFALLRVGIDLTLLAVARPEGAVGVILCEISSFAIALIALLALRRFGRPDGRPGLDRKSLQSLVKSGIPLAAMGFVGALALYVDRLAVGQSLGHEAAGIYNFHYLVFLPTIAIYNIIYQHALPNINRKYRLGISRSEVILVIFDNGRLILLACAVVLIFGYVFLPLAATHFYNLSIDYTLIFLISVSSVAFLINGIEIILISRDRYNSVLTSNLMAVIFMLGAFFVAWLTGAMSLTYAAATFVLSRILVFGLNVFAIRRMLAA